MTQLQDLLNSEQVQQLKDLTTPHDEHPSWWYEMTENLALTRGVVIDPQSEAMIETTCADCNVAVLIDPVPVPQDLAHLPRIPLCRSCGKARVQGKRGQIIHTPRIARHQWRVTCTPEELAAANAQLNTSQEDTMPIDLTAVPAARLNLVLETALRNAALDLAAEAPAKRKKAKARAAKKEQAEVKAAKAERTARKAAAPLGSFEVGSLVVPALDLTDVTSMDELVSAKVRSPYNKARFRLANEPTLDPELTTYAVIAAEHTRLSALAAQKATNKTSTVKTPKVKKQVVVDIDLDAKVNALTSTLGWSAERAIAFLSA